MQQFHAHAMQRYKDYNIIVHTKQSWNAQNVVTKIVVQGQGSQA